MLLLALALAAPPPPALAELAARLASAPAWHVGFVQEFVPAGFETGTEEAGTLLLAPPSRLRFDYGASGRVFAVDGTIARHVDQPAGVCDAVALTASAWARLPLSTLLDPGAAAKAFVVEPEPGGLRLLPREPVPELASLRIERDREGNVTRLEVTDETGNRNVFVFSGWTRVSAPDPSRFQPRLPGQDPCQPEVQ
ncbi:MAG TPA: outer-membrane lipoprotein carrier protein LolA [Thermoanaerobaculaceae bacterium]|nr:outer-membrane lipoprotein carrier protein LolA [Thermoanaerobaculaceae bacterium]HRS17463.1 outer-membrane lipoprotein carrier protein LolA [Thermoanaerobaculaceae bacterium]